MRIINNNSGDNNSVLLPTLEINNFTAKYVPYVLIVLLVLHKLFEKNVKSQSKSTSCSTLNLS